MAKHDENKDLRLFGRIGRVNLGDNTLRAPKTATIGIRMWGRIDYLTHHCGWHFIWDNTVKKSNHNNDDDKPSKQDIRTKKKEDKAPKLTNKKKR